MAQAPLTKGQTLIYIVIIFAGLFAWAAVVAKRQERELEASFTSIPDFQPAYRHTKALNFTVGLDPDRKKIAVARLKTPPRVVRFDELVAVELNKDGAPLEKTNRGSQLVGMAVGAIALGPLGAIVGGLSGSKRTVPKVRKLAVKLYTTSLDAPVVEIAFIESGRGKKPSVADLETLDLWYGRVRAAMHEPNATASPPAARAVSAEPVAS